MSSVVGSKVTVTFNLPSKVMTNQSKEQQHFTMASSVLYSDWLVVSILNQSYNRPLAYRHYGRPYVAIAARFVRYMIYIVNIYLTYDSSSLVVAR
jgi:hypothetical protein